MSVQRRVRPRQALTEREIAELTFGLAPGYPSAFPDPDEREAARRTLERLQQDWDGFEWWRWSLDIRLPEDGGTRRIGEEGTT